MGTKQKAGKKVDFGTPDDEFGRAVELYKFAVAQKAFRDQGEGVPVSVLKEARGSTDWVADALAREIKRRLLVLMDYYGIERGQFSRALSLDTPNYAMLAMRMAEEFHGLTDFLRRGRGAPKKSFLKKKEFVSEIDAIMNERQKGISDACEILRKRQGKWQGKERAALERQYHREREYVENKCREDKELYRIAAEIVADRPAADENR